MTPVADTIACARIDAHVHLHPRFDAAVFLDHAVRNAGGTPVLCLTESVGVDRFAELLATGAAGDWTIAPTAEPESAIATRGSETVVLIAGRQVIPTERLEVLALATRASIPDGLPLDATIDAALAADAIPVLPWAMGKWWGARGAHITQTLGARTDVFVADQAGRPRTAPGCPVLARARACGHINLPGSDPLDLDAHVARPASYGFTLADAGSEAFALDACSPAADLRARLRALKSSPPVLGTRTSLPSCIRDQIALRVSRRRKTTR